MFKPNFLITGKMAQILMRIESLRKEIDNLPILFSVSQRTARDLCHRWVEAGFLIIKNPSKKSRTYALASHYQLMMESK